MPIFNKEYLNTLKEKLNEISDGLDDRLEAVIEGRVTPALDDIAIGSAKKMRAAVLFFDIRNFSSRTGSPDLKTLKKTLLMLDCVIPMVMQIIYDFDGYIEKNTGDGIMAIIGSEQEDKIGTKNALDAALTIFYVLKNVINPYLKQQGIAPVDARIGIDIGDILIAKVGLRSGTAKHQRNFLTAIGPAANIASKIQQLGDTNEILVGDLIYTHAAENRKKYFVDITPAPSNWNWIYLNTPNRYKVWKYNSVWLDP